MIDIVAEFPEKLKFLFRPGPSFADGYRYKVAHGGRGGAKSWNFARALIIKGAQKKRRILCAREIQNSIDDSVHKLLKEQIELLGLSSFYEVQKTCIYGRNGTEFLFKGLRSNDQTKIKSLEGIDICWVEEAQAVSDDSWERLIPTVRGDDSEVWISFNPDLDTDPTYRRFVTNPPPSSCVVQINWSDNPWLPKVLLDEKDYLYRVDTESADHVWGGKTRRNSAASVLRGRYTVESFEPGADWNGPYFGADWGFGVDPTAALKLWINERVLYVEYEAYGIGIDLDDTPALFDSIPKARDHVMRADNSRPETISHMRRHGYTRILPCQKGPGSVEDGVEHLRSYERIVIHPRCQHTAEEARLWSYKVDRLTGDVLPVLLDRNNHCLIGSTMVETPDGPARIDSLVGKSGQVMAFADGEVMPSSFERARVTSESENVYRLLLSNGTEVVATGEHMLLSDRGLVPLLYLRPGDRLVDAGVALRYALEPCNKSIKATTASVLSATTKPGTSHVPSSNPFPSACTDMFGNAREALSRQAHTFTTSTATGATTPSPTCSRSAHRSIRSFIGLSLEKIEETLCAPILRRHARPQGHGTVAQMGMPGTSSTAAESWHRSSLSGRPASIAEKPTIASVRCAFARMLASLLRADPLVSITSRENALCVERNSPATNMQPPKHAPGIAGQSWLTVIAVKPAGRAKVYNLEVPGPHMYVLSGGVVSSNCWDAARYALEPIIRAGKPGKHLPPPPPKRHDYNTKSRPVDRWKVI